MKRPLVLAFAAAATLFATTAAQAARVDWSVGINVPPVAAAVGPAYVGYPGYVAPQVVYAPRPRLVVEPAPYYAPRPRVWLPPLPPLPRLPWVGYDRWHDRGDDGWRHDEREGWRDHDRRDHDGRGGHDGRDGRDGRVGHVGWRN